MNYSHLTNYKIVRSEREWRSQPIRRCRIEIDGGDRNRERWFMVEYRGVSQMTRANFLNSTADTNEGGAVQNDTGPTMPECWLGRGLHVRVGRVRESGDDKYDSFLYIVFLLKNEIWGKKMIFILGIKHSNSFAIPKLIKIIKSTL